MPFFSFWKSTPLISASASAGQKHSRSASPGSPSTMTGMMRSFRPSSMKWPTSSFTQCSPFTLGFAECGEQTTIRYLDASSSSLSFSRNTATPRSLTYRNTGRILTSSPISLRATDGSL